MKFRYTILLFNYVTTVKSKVNTENFMAIDKKYKINKNQKTFLLKNKAHMKIC